MERRWKLAWRSALLHLIHVEGYLIYSRIHIKWIIAAMLSKW